MAVSVDLDETDDGRGLYLSDKAIAKRLGIGENLWARRVLELDGLPPRDPLFGHRRYWPAVRAFLDRRNGLGGISNGFGPEEEEHWDVPPRRARSKAPAAG